MNSPFNARFNGRSRIALLTATLLLTSLFACTQSPDAQDADVNSGSSSGSASGTASGSGTPRMTRVTVAQGTEIHMTLSTTIDSETSQAGDPLNATTTTGVLVGNHVAIPAGSTIRGQVTEVSPATKGLKVSEKGGGVVLSFDKVTTPVGNSAGMSASLVKVASSKGKTAGIIGGSAAGGALLGKILGGSTKDAAVGAVVGGGIGTGIAAGTKGKKLVIPAGTDLVITLDQPLTIAVRS